MTRSSLYRSTTPGYKPTLEDVGRSTGTRFYVDSGSAVAEDSAGNGRHPDKPLATIDYAIGQASANNGDIIYVLPGHVEDLASGESIDADVAGITIEGMGKGADVPRIDYNHATAAFDIGANGVTVRNLRLRPSVATVAIGIDVEAGVTDTLLEGIEILPGEEGDGTDEFVLGVDIKAGCSRTVIRDLKARHHASAGGVNAVISLTGASDDVLIEGCDLVATGAAVVAPIKGITTASTNLRIKGCTLVSDAEPGIELYTGTSGVISDCDIFSNLATVAAAIVTDGCALFRNEYVEAAGESGATIGTASAND